MRIAQLSDTHVLDPRFEERLLDAAIEEINADDPDLVVVARARRPPARSVRMAGRRAVPGPLRHSERLARYPRPSGPIGEHRDPIVRRQQGGSFRSEPD